MRRALLAAALVVLVNDLALAALFVPSLRIPALVGLAAVGIAGLVWVPVTLRTEREQAPERHELADALDALDERVGELESEIEGEDETDADA